MTIADSIACPKDLFVQKIEILAEKNYDKQQFMDDNMKSPCKQIQPGGRGMFSMQKWCFFQ
jgi:hypothetical protein